MSLIALLLALGAAFLHAFWNLLLARARDVESATAVALVAAVVVFAPVTALVWHVEAEAVPFIAVTSALQFLYFVLLAASYGRAELSFVYPVARGAAPVLVLLAGIAVLGIGTSVLQVGGVLLVGAGVLLVRGFGGHARTIDLGLALAVAACIASYTLVDKYGIRHAAPVVYLELSMTPATLGFVVMTRARRGRAAIRRSIGWTTVAAGLASFGAYALVLAALSRAPAASVAAVRETSVVIATALAAPLLGERVGVPRLAGAVLVVAGIVLLGS